MCSLSLSPLTTGRSLSFQNTFLALLQDVTHGSQYVETIIAKCIDSYTARRAEEGVTIDNRLEDIVNKMFDM